VHYGGGGGGGVIKGAPAQGGKNFASINVAEGGTKGSWALGGESSLENRTIGPQGEADGTKSNSAGKLHKKCKTGKKGKQAG